MLTRPITRPLTRPITRPLVRQSSTFDPLSLFSEGQQGVWYDPSDLTTLFQDSAGTTPVTADGDPVGLMLDKHLGLVRGEELLVSPTWSAGNGASINVNAGAVTITGGSNTNPKAESSIISGLTVGATYEVTAKTTAGSWTNGMVARFDNSVGSGSHEVTAGGVIKFVAVASNPSTRITLFLNSTTAPTGQSATFYDISVRELPGNHAYQDTTAAKPTYRTDGIYHWLEGDGDDDFMSTSRTSSILTGPFLYGHVAKAPSSFLSVFQERVVGDATIGRRMFIDTRNNPTRLYFTAQVATEPPSIERLTPVPPDTFVVDTILRVGNTVYGYTNGVFQGSLVDTGGDLTATLEMFLTAGSPTPGTIQEVVLSGGDWTEADRERLEKYLADKHGVPLP